MVLREKNPYIIGDEFLVQIKSICFSNYIYTCRFSGFALELASLFDCLLKSIYR